jgi:tRNA nucleotidyltransferase (CCA-adding enzyme)
VKAVPDVLWGQLYKSQRSLRKLLRVNDFKVLRDVAWSDEKDLNTFVFELEQYCISSVRKHYGPPLAKEKECEKFVAKYVHNTDVVCGPYVEESRWVVHVKRKYTNACTLLREKLKDGGRNAGVAERISHVLKKGFKVLIDEEIDAVYKKNDAFAVFLADFLEGRPKWLETG